MGKSNEKDILNREAVVEELINIINHLPIEGQKNSSFAIDGEWGVGKSFILTDIEEKLKDSCFVVKYNAWENDFYEEPLTAILSVFVDIINNENKIDKFFKGAKKEVLKKTKEILVGFFGYLSEKVVGIDLVKAGKKIKSDVSKTIEGQELQKDFDNLLTFKKVMSDIRDALSEIAKEVKIIFIVDELDRCLPEYSIKVLERLHHLFDSLAKSVVIFGINKKQINGTIKQIFNLKNDDEESVQKYLKKFIDFEYQIDNGILDKESFKEQLKQFADQFTNDINNYGEELNYFYKIIMSGLEIREKIKLLEKVQLLHKLYILPILKERKADISLLAFEIFVVFADYIGASIKNLSFFQEPKSAYINDDFIKVSFNNIEKEIKNKNIIEIYNSFFYYIKVIPNKNNIGTYHNEIFNIKNSDETKRIYSTEEVIISEDCMLSNLVFYYCKRYYDKQFKNYVEELNNNASVRYIYHPTIFRKPLYGINWSKVIENEKYAEIFLNNYKIIK